MNGQGFEGIVRDTNFSVKRGFYESTFNVEEDGGLATRSRGVPWVGFGHPVVAILS